MLDSANESWYNVSVPSERETPSQETSTAILAEHHFPNVAQATIGGMFYVAEYFC